MSSTPATTEEDRSSVDSDIGSAESKGMQQTQHTQLREVIDLTKEEEEEQFSTKKRKLSTEEEVLVYVHIACIDGCCSFDYKYKKMSVLSEDDMILVHRVPAMSWEDIMEDQAMCEFFEINKSAGAWHAVEAEDQTDPQDGNMLMKIPSGYRITQIVNIFEQEI